MASDEFNEKSSSMDSGYVGFGVMFSVFALLGLYFIGSASDDAKLLAVIMTSASTYGAIHSFQKARQSKSLDI